MSKAHETFQLFVLVMAAAFLAIVIAYMSGCGGANTQASSHSAITAACVERERHIVDRDSGMEEDERDLTRLRAACDDLLEIVKEMRK